MAQPATLEVNGVPAPEGADNAQPISTGKRKRDPESEDDADDDVEMAVAHEDGKPSAANGVIVGDQKQLVKAYFEVLSR